MMVVMTIMMVMPIVTLIVVAITLRLVMTQMAAVVMPIALPMFAIAAPVVVADDDGAGNSRRRLRDRSGQLRRRKGNRWCRQTGQLRQRG